MPIRSEFDPRRMLDAPALHRVFQRLAGREKAARRIVELLAIKSGDRVLISCGTADVVQYLPASVDYYGFDVSRDYVAAARRRFGTRSCFAVQAVIPGLQKGSDVLISSLH